MVIIRHSRKIIVVVRVGIVRVARIKLGAVSVVFVRVCVVRGRGGRTIKVRPIIGLIDKKPDFILDPREVDGILNISLKDLNSPKFQGLKKMTFKNEIAIDAPFYDVHGNMVWGATAMIISELLALVKPILEE